MNSTVRVAFLPGTRSWQVDEALVSESSLFLEFEKKLGAPLQYLCTPGTDYVFVVSLQSDCDRSKRNRAASRLSRILSENQVFLPLFGDAFLTKISRDGSSISMTENDFKQLQSILQ